MREVPVRMPKFSMAQEEGLLLSWHKAVGDSVAAGEPLCDVATDKVDMEVESPVSGRITKLVAEPNASVPVGEPIALVETEADDLLEGLLQPTDSPPAAAAAGDDATGASGAGEVGEPAPEPESGLATAPSRKARQPAMPGARRRAAELGIDLSTVTGSGPDGAITLRDLDRVATAQVPQLAPEPAPAPTARPPVPAQAAASVVSIDPGYSDALAGRRRSVRAAIARTMSQSAAIPQFTVEADLHLDALAAARAGLGWTTWLVRALALTAREHASLNTLWLDDHAEPAGSVGVSLAIDTPVGLLAPVVREADVVDMQELDRQVRRTVDRARNGRLTAADLEGGTITLSNLGPFGVRSFNALLTPPQVAAFSAGSISQQPVVRGGGLTVALVCRVGLTVDHRAADGADAARFLADLARLVADPERLAATPATSRVGAS